jgi:hypothetical protein
MDKKEWCDTFVAAWALLDPARDRSFVSVVASQSFDHEGVQVLPQVSAQEHLKLLRRVTRTMSRVR